MATVPATNVAEVEIRGSLNGQDVENTLYFELAEAITNAALELLVAAIEDWVHTNWLNSMGTGFTMREVFARDLTAGSGFNATSNTHAGSPGTQSGTNLPGSVAWVVKFLTPLAGRSFRGRNYFMGLTNTDVTANLLGSATAANIVGYYRMLLGGGGVLPDGWTWGVLSRFAAGAPRVSGLFTPVTNVGYTDLLVDAQRKRLY